MTLLLACYIFLGILGYSFGITVTAAVLDHTAILEDDDDMAPILAAIWPASMVFIPFMLANRWTYLRLGRWLKRRAERRAARKQMAPLPKAQVRR